LKQDFNALLEGKDPEFIRRSWNRLNNQFSAEIARAKAELCEKEEEKRVKRTEERARTNVNTKKRKLVQSFWIDNNLYVSFKRQKSLTERKYFIIAITTKWRRMVTLN